MGKTKTCSECMCRQVDAFKQIKESVLNSVKFDADAQKDAAIRKALKDGKTQHPLTTSGAGKCSADAACYTTNYQHESAGDKQFIKFVIEPKGSITKNSVFYVEVPAETVKQIKAASPDKVDVIDCKALTFKSKRWKDIKTKELEEYVVQAKVDAIETSPCNVLEKPEGHNMFSFAKDTLEFIFHQCTGEYRKDPSGASSMGDLGVLEGGGAPEGMSTLDAGHPGVSAEEEAAVGDVGKSEKKPDDEKKQGSGNIMDEF